MNPLSLSFSVMPAKAGIQGKRRSLRPWIPAFAGMTELKRDRPAQAFFADWA
jgi:hypothetical protein